MRVRATEQRLVHNTSVEHDDDAAVGVGMRAGDETNAADADAHEDVAVEEHNARHAANTTNQQYLVDTGRKMPTMVLADERVDIPELAERRSNGKPTALHNIHCRCRRQGKGCNQCPRGRDSPHRW